MGYFTMRQPTAQWQISVYRPCIHQQHNHI